MKIIHYLGTMMTAISCISCSLVNNNNLYASKATTVIEIKGEPGTRIFSHSGERLGQIQPNGTLEIALSDYSTYVFFLAEKPGTGQRIPFALDYVGKKNQTYMVYAHNQITNQDMPLKLTSYHEKASVKSSERVVQVPRTEVHSNNGSAARYSLNNFSKQIIGEYYGTGILRNGQKIVDTISNMKVVVSQVDNKSVKVHILVDDSDFFYNDDIYDVKKLEDGSFQLTCDKLKGSIITINDENLIYKNPNVNIDDSNYNLMIDAKIHRASY